MPSALPQPWSRRCLLRRGAGLCLVAASLALPLTGRAAAQQNEATPAPAKPTAPSAMPPVVWDDPMFDFGEARVTVPKPTPVNTTPPRVVELLAGAMKGQRAERRASLLAEIAACKLPQGVPHVRAALADADSLVKLEAIRSAGVMADKALRDDVAPFLTHADPVVRREALVAAHAIDTAGAAPHTGSTGAAPADPASTDAASPAVAAVLADAAAPRAVMIAALRRAAPAQAPAVAALLSKLPPSLRPEAARALARLKASAHAGDVLPLLASDDPAQRAAGLHALGEIGATDRLDAVLNLIDDEHPTVRRSALVAVGRLADVMARQQRASAAMEDPDGSVRIAAANIFERDPLPGAVPVLMRHLSDPLPDLHDAARAALANPAIPEMREDVTDRAAALLADPLSARRIDGSYLLGRLRSDKNRARHVSFLDIKERVADMDVPLMVQAAESLGQIGVKEAGPFLAELARRTPTTVLAGNPKNFLGADAHVVVFVACGKLAEPGVLPEARRLLSVSGGQPSPLRGAAVFALAAATDAGDAEVNARLISIAGNDAEYSSARYEAIKALVRRQVPGTGELFQRLAADSKDAYAKFAAHWAVERLTGERRPYVPPTAPWQAVTSISDLKTPGVE